MSRGMRMSGTTTNTQKSHRLEWFKKKNIIPMSLYKNHFTCHKSRDFFPVLYVLSMQFCDIAKLKIAEFLNQTYLISHSCLFHPSSQLYNPSVFGSVLSLCMSRHKRGMKKCTQKADFPDHFS